MIDFIVQKKSRKTIKDSSFEVITIECSPQLTFDLIRLIPSKAIYLEVADILRLIEDWEHFNRDNHIPENHLIIKAIKENLSTINRIFSPDTEQTTQ